MPTHIIIPIAYLIGTAISLTLLFRIQNRQFQGQRATATVTSAPLPGTPPLTATPVEVRYQPEGSVQIQAATLAVTNGKYPQVGEQVAILYSPEAPESVVSASLIHRRRLPFYAIAVMAPILAVALFFILQE